jgi:hypothetical protein
MAGPRGERITARRGVAGSELRPCDCHFLWTEFRNRRRLMTVKLIALGDDLRAAKAILQLRQRTLNSAGVMTHRLLQISQLYEVINDHSGGASTSEL